MTFTGNQASTTPRPSILLLADGLPVFLWVGLNCAFAGPMLLRPTVSGAGANNLPVPVLAESRSVIPEGVEKSAYEAGTRPDIARESTTLERMRGVEASGIGRHISDSRGGQFTFEASGVKYASGGKNEGAMSSCIARPLASFVL